MAVNVFEIFGTIGAKDNASKVLDDVAGKAKETNRTLSKTLTSIGNVSTKVGTKLTSFITKPAIGAAGALTGITLVKGFGRLLGIDEAKAKLKGLGHNAQSVETIMNSALESVKGTAHGMDEAATTAASAVAAGIKPGKELTRYLSLTGDAAAIAGSSMAEMGSIINKVQTGQKAYTENLEQLADRGLPIYQWLAEEAGVAASEVKELASSGEISSETFLNAIEKNIGGAAKTIGESSFKASIANLWASVGRIGANFLDADGKGGGFFSKIKPLVGDLTERLGGLEKKAAEFGEKFGQSFQVAIDFVTGLIAKFDALSPAAQGSLLKTIGIGATVAVSMGPALQIFGKFSSVLGVGAQAVENMNSKIGLLTVLSDKGLKKVGANTTGVVSKTTGGLTKIMGFALQLVGPGVIVAALLAGLGLVMKMFGPQIDELLTIAETKGPQIIGKLSEGIRSKLPGLVEDGAMLLAGFGQALVVNLPAIFELGTTVITSLIQGLVQGLPYLFPVAIQLVNGLFNGLVKALPKILMAGLELLQGLIKGIVDNIPLIFQTGISMIKTFLKTITESLPKLLGAGIKILFALVKGIIVAIPELIKAIPTIWQALKDGFVAIDWGEIGKTILDGIGQGLADLGATFATLFEPLTNWASEKGTQISDAFKKAGENAKTSWSGTKEYFKGVGDSIKHGFDETIKWFQGLPAWFNKKWKDVKRIFSDTLSSIKGYFDEYFGWIYPYVEGVFNGLHTYFTGVWEIIKNIFLGPILLIVTFFTEGFDSMKDTAYQIMGNILNGISLIWEGIKGIFLNSTGAIIMYLVNGFISMKDAVFQKMGEIVETIQTKWNQAVEWMTGLPGRLWLAATNAYESAKIAVSTKMSEVYQSAVDKWNATVEWMTGLPDRIWTAVTNAWNKAVEAVSEKMTAVFDTVSEKWTEATDFLSSIDLMEIGKNVIEGFFNGIKEKWDELKDTVSDMAGSVKKTFKKILGIKSPSTVMEEQGGFVVAGVQQGITTSQGSVQTAVSGVADVITGAFNNIGSSINLGSITHQGVQIATEMVNGVRQGLAQLPAVGSIAMNQFAMQLSMRSGVSINAGRQLGQGILNGVRAGLSKLPSVGMTYMNLFINMMMTKATQGKMIGGRVGQTLTAGVDSSRSSVVSSANRVMTVMINAILSFLSKVRNAGIRLMQMLNAGITSMQSTVLNRVMQIAKEIVRTFEKQGSAMRNAGAELIRKLAQGITSSKSAVGTAMRGVSGTMLSAIEKGINGVLGGVNHVMGQVGSTKKVKAWTIPKYAKGTDGHVGGLAMVNDASTGPYQEAYQTPDGQVGLFPRMKNLLVNMQKGTKVLSGKMTARLGIPRYEEGIGFDEDIFNFMDDPKGLLQKAVDAKTNLKGVVEPWLDMTKSAMKMMTDAAVPMIKTEMDSLMVSGGGGPGAFAPTFPNPPFIKTSDRGGRWGTFHAGIDFGAPIGTPIPANNPGRVVRAEGGVGGFGKWVVVEVAKGIMAIYGHISKWLVNAGQNVRKGQNIALVGNEGQSTGPHLHYELRKGLGGPSLDPYTYGAPSGGAGGSGVARWKPTVIQALLKNALPTSANYVNAWMRQIQTESGGNEKAIGGNDGLADGNAMGLLQVKPGTFNAYKHKGFNQILRGLDNALAAMNYAKNRYGKTGMLGVIGHGHGYANGGFSSKHKLAQISEGDRLESIIPLTKTKRAWEVISQSIGYLVGKGSVPDVRALDARSISTKATPTTDTSSNDSEMLGDMFSLFKEFVTLFKEGKFGVYMDNYKVGSMTAEPNDFYQGQRIDLTGRGLNI